MGGQWSGGVANRTWQRPGSRTRNLPGDTERSARLFQRLQHARFWCDVCGGTHQLIETAYQLMYERSLAGQAPAGFDVPP